MAEKLRAALGGWPCLPFFPLAVLGGSRCEHDTVNDRGKRRPYVAGEQDNAEVEFEVVPVDLSVRWNSKYVPLQSATISKAHQFKVVGNAESKSMQGMEFGLGGFLGLSLFTVQPFCSHSGQFPAWLGTLVPYAWALAKPIAARLVVSSECSRETLRCT